MSARWSLAPYRLAPSLVIPNSLAATIRTSRFLTVLTRAGDTLLASFVDLLELGWQ